MASLEELEIDTAEPIFDSVSIPQEIKRFRAKDISYEKFFRYFLQTNTAVILTSIANTWECYQQWVTRDCTEVDNVDVSYLKARIDNVSVPVADCGKQHYNAHEKTEMNFFDFLDYWKNCGPERTGSKLYLKDWHLCRELPEYKFYQTPIFFASDWLNEFLIDRNLDDYMFVYIGIKDTWTSFHADVFSSFSWSTNITGEKKWLLLPPGEEVKLMDVLGNLPFEISEELLDSKEVLYYTVYQTAGEALFVPSGWYHQVHNIKNSISVNHNWFNGCNVTKIWRSLDRALEQVVKEIEDCRSMENFDEHCQLMLKASHGMNYYDFTEIITHVCMKRLCAYVNETEVVHFDRFRLGKNHIRFDIESIQNILNLMLVRRNLLEKLQLFSKLEKCTKLINDTF
ncbi:2-oxoglutarate and iron-dependent oxygenase JMJD4 homolog [Malaya genurostris]|uniref:2-oxoglutarate and iron-dependent oxygenase JMJD4 homolog n=1 Tax=Malaya genurostris TaxID=325434 RepID=UPI0026F39ED9|nr:2-oxoglutarate and iron-dependent oxygenase JMJD4 homolog [Malaya genurostris]